MLYNFRKYKLDSKSLIDIKYKNIKFVATSRYCIKIRISPFFRKMFFRTLLFYLNLLYCNYFYFAEQNYFYFVAFMYANSSTDHDSFYHRNIYKS